MVEGSLRPGPAGPARHKGHVRRPFDSEATQAWQPSSPTAYLLLYGTMYAAFGVASPFWPRLFESKGLTPQQIGLILSAALLVRLAAGPLIGRVADILAALRLVTRNLYGHGSGRGGFACTGQQFPSRSSRRHGPGCRPRAGHIPC